MNGRIRNARIARKITDAATAASLIKPGSNVGTSGFTGSGHPKRVPAALAERLAELGDQRIALWTGASTAPEV